MLEIETREHLNMETGFEELMKILGHINDPSAKQMLEAIEIRKTNMVGGCAMTYSEAYNDCLTAYGDMVASIEDRIPSVWRWLDTPSLPMVYVPRPVLPMIAPFIDGRFNQFFGHKFSLGGSKK